MTTPQDGDALVVVDVQRDFCPGGTLAVPEGDRVIPVANALLAQFHQAGRPIALTRDWHPPGHVSFQARGGPWPPHCVQNTAGADFHPGLSIPPEAERFSKGTAEDRDAYSGFEGVSDAGTPLHDWLRANGARRLWVVGLATDYCVRATVLDALAHGYAARVIADGVRGVEVQPEDTARALAEMARAGAEVLPAVPPEPDP